MKTTIKSIVMIVMFTIMSLRAHAGAINTNYPASLPIGSVAQLEQYALASVARGYIAVYSEGMDWSNPQGRSFDEREFVKFRPSEGLGWINTQKLSLYLYKTNQVSYTYGAFSDSTGWPLFWSSTESQPYLDGGVWRFEKARLAFRMNDSIPLPEEGVAYGEIFERDEDGNVVWYYQLPSQEYYNSEGKIQSRHFFPAFAAGRNGELVLQKKGGGQAVYNLKGGEQIPSQRFEESVFASFPGVREVKDDGVVIEVTEKDYYNNVPQVTLLDVTKKTKTVFSARLPNNGPYASKVIIRKKGEELLPGKSYSIPSNRGGIMIDTDVGQYWVEFVFESWTQNGGYQRPYTEGSGKGDPEPVTPVQVPAE